MSLPAAAFVLAAAFAGSAGLAYGSVLGFLYLRQRSLMYCPRREATAPAAAGLPQAVATVIRTADGERLEAWFVPGRDEEPLLLYFHGNGGRLADRAARFLALTADGAALLTIDYRGYGASTGSPTEAGLHLDADAAYAEALARGYPPERIVLIGESLGTAVAIALAARANVAGLVLEAAFSSALDVARSAYWMFPVGMLMRDTFRSDRHIAAVTAPTLFIHGTLDEVVPLSLGERLFALAPEPKAFVKVDGGRHQVLEWPAAMAEVHAFIAARGAAAKARKASSRVA